MIWLSGQGAGAAGGINVLGSLLTVRGLMIDGYVFGSDGLPESLTIASAPLPAGAGSKPVRTDSYTIDLTAEGRLQAQVQSQGLTTRLTLLDSQSNVLVQSDGQGTGDIGGLIDQHLPAGNYYLEVEITAGSGEYQLKTAFTPTSSSFQGQSAVAGDFNGDGRLDFVASDGVHLGLGDGTFRSPLAGLGLPARYDSQHGSRTMYAGDFTGDGKLDLLIDDFYVNDIYFGPASGINNDLLLILGNGDGTFQSTTYVVGDYGNIGPVVTGDFTGDGRLDIAFAEGSQVCVLLSNGNGTFQAPETYRVGNATDSIGSLVAGDFNGEGKLDLAAASGGVIGVLLGNGDGTFRPPVVTNVPSGIVSLVVGDFNGNGKTDLVASYNRGNDISIFLSNGDGTFDSPTNIPLPFSPNYIQVGDFNGDGKLDLLAWSFMTFELAHPQRQRRRLYSRARRPRCRPRAPCKIPHALIGTPSPEMASSDLFEPSYDSQSVFGFDSPTSFTGSCWAMATPPFRQRARIRRIRSLACSQWAISPATAEWLRPSRAASWAASPSCWVTVRRDIRLDSRSRWDRSRHCPSRMSTATAGSIWSRIWACFSGTATGLSRPSSLRLLRTIACRRSPNSTPCCRGSMPFPFKPGTSTGTAISTLPSWE